MAISYKNPDEEESIIAEINITPLTDIFLVLLIIFMISSSAIFEGGLQVRLPSAKTAQLNKSKGSKPTFVTISANGSVSVNDHAIQADQNLKDVLKKALQESPDKAVIIRGDQSIVLGKAVEIMDTARSVGAEKIALATQTPQ